MPENCLDFYTQEEIANPKTLTRRNLLDSMKQKNTGHLTLPSVAKIMKENSEFQINVRSRSIRHKTMKVKIEEQISLKEPTMLSDKSMKFLANIRSKSVFEKGDRVPSSNTAARI